MSFAIPKFFAFRVMRCSVLQAERKTFSTEETGLHLADVFICFFLKSLLFGILIQISLRYVPTGLARESYHWYMKWLGAVQVTIHYLSQR